MSYRINPDLVGGASKAVRFQGTAIASKLNRCEGIEGDNEFTRVIKNDVQKYLRKWLAEVTIKEDAAKRDARSIDRLIKNADIHLTAIEMIAARCFDFKGCRYARIHHNVTRLARELRQHLRLGARQLVNVDIRNSQPLLLGAVLTMYRLQGGGDIDPRQWRTTNPSNPFRTTTTLPTTTHTQHHSRPPLTNTIPITGLKLPEGHENKAVTSITELLSPDEVKWVEMCEAGTVYEELQKLGSFGNVDRDAVKQLVFKLMFDKPSAVAKSVLGRNFEEAFPTVSAFIRHAKKDNYRTLARLMQHTEATVVLNDACRWLMTNRPDIGIVSIHDSLMCFPEHVDAVKGALKMAFGRIGLLPAFKVEGQQFIKASRIA